MKRGKKFKHRKYIRYFIYGFILAALAFGSIGVKLARPDTSEPVQCEPLIRGFVNHLEQKIVNRSIIQLDLNAILTR